MRCARYIQPAFPAKAVIGVAKELSSVLWPLGHKEATGHRKAYGRSRRVLTVRKTPTWGPNKVVWEDQRTQLGRTSAQYEALATAESCEQG